MVQERAVQRTNSLLRFLSTRHLHERESACLPGVAIVEHLDRLDGSVSSKYSSKLLLGSREIQIADKNINHRLPLLRGRKAIAFSTAFFRLDRINAFSLPSLRSLDHFELHCLEARHWFLGGLAVTLGFDGLLAANIHLDLLRLSFRLLGELDLKHAVVVGGRHLPRIHGVRQRERAGEASVLPLDATEV